MSSNSRATEYRMLVEDVIAGGLLEEDEILELRDMLARAQRRMQAKMPAENQRATELRNVAEEAGNDTGYHQERMADHR